jgi:hypothetical protein
MKTRNFFVAVLAIVAALVVMPQNSDAQILKGLGKKIKEKVEETAKTAKTAKTDAPAATTATTSSSNSSV